MTKLTSELLHQIGRELIGTCKSTTEVIEQHDLYMDDNDLLDQLIGISVEPCQGCGWWFASSELDGVDPETGETIDGDVGLCTDCRRDDYDELA